MNQKFVDFDHTCNELGISPEELTELRESGEVRAYRDGASWKFRRDDIERLKTKYAGFLSITEACELLEVDASEFAKLRSDDRLKPYRDGNQMKFRRGDLLRLRDELDASKGFELQEIQFDLADPTDEVLAEPAAETDPVDPLTALQQIILWAEMTVMPQALHVRTHELITVLKQVGKPQFDPDSTGFSDICAAARDGLPQREIDAALVAYDRLSKVSLESLFGQAHEAYETLRSLANAGEAERTQLGYFAGTLEDCFAVCLVLEPALELYYGTSQHQLRGVRRGLKQLDYGLTALREPTFQG